MVLLKDGEKSSTMYKMAYEEARPLMCFASKHSLKVQKLFLDLDISDHRRLTWYIKGGIILRSFLAALIIVRDNRSISLRFPAGCLASKGFCTASCIQTLPSAARESRHWQ